jgi:8-oxo-dGTP diphosphatase
MIGHLLGLISFAVVLVGLGRHINYELDMDRARTVTLLLAGVTCVSFLFSIFVPLGFIVYVPAWLLVGFSVANLQRATTDMEYRAQTDLLRSRRPEHKFCPNCTTELAERLFDGKAKMACTRCNYVHWKNPLVVAVGLVASPDGKKLLLIKRSNPPRAGFYALPGGFLETGEGLAEGCVREIKEETGYDVRVERMMWEVAIRDKNEILVFFVATIVGGEARTSSETSEVDFFSFAEIPAEIAFPTHKQAIEMFRLSLAQPAVEIDNVPRPSPLAVSAPGDEAMDEVLDEHESRDIGC